MLREVLDFKKIISDKKKLVVIYGPTGSGKTNMSIEIAKYLDTDIISTDSRQIFKYMNIGTGKITEEEKKGVIHYMLDIITPNQEYSVGEYKKASEKKMEELYKKGKIPMLVGGTGLYIDSLIFDFAVEGVPSDKTIREELESQAEEFGANFVYNKLKEIDPDYAKQVHPNNIQYIIRGIEVKMLTGKSKLSFRREKKLKYDVLFLTPDYGERENLYSRINKRVGMMFDEGLEKEFKNLIDMGYTEKSFGMKSIGYKEFFPYMRGEYSLEEVKDKIRQYSRNYAKRQLTWFRKYNQYK